MNPSFPNRRPTACGLTAAALVGLMLVPAAHALVVIGGTNLEGDRVTSSIPTKVAGINSVFRDQIVLDGIPGKLAVSVQSDAKGARVGLSLKQNFDDRSGVTLVIKGSTANPSGDPADAVVAARALLTDLVDVVLAALTPGMTPRVPDNFTVKLSLPERGLTVDQGTSLKLVSKRGLILASASVANGLVFTNSDMATPSLGVGFSVDFSPPAANSLHIVVEKKP